MRKLKLKVCGMRDPENIQELIALQPDFIGFIFYEKSARFAGNVQPDALANIPKEISKVGVFVNASIEQIEAQVSKLGLDYVQLHGDESISFSINLREKGIKLIRVFRVTDSLPADIDDYKGIADFILLDTATSGYGGSGQHFDWKILEEYTSEIPLLLSGGIRLEDLNTIRNLDLKNLVGIDVNSRFELAPALKDVKKVEELISQL